jgi:hypothetical protein
MLATPGQPRLAAAGRAGQLAAAGSSRALRGAVVRPGAAAPYPPGRVRPGAAGAGVAGRAASWRPAGPGSAAHCHRRGQPRVAGRHGADRRAVAAALQPARPRTRRLGGPARQHPLGQLPATSYPARPARTVPDFPGCDFGHGRGWGLPSTSAYAAARSAGVACLLTTAGDGPCDWVNAGQALQRVLLTSAACGVAAALHSQPLELAWLRKLIRDQGRPRHTSHPAPTPGITASRC